MHPKTLVTTTGAHFVAAWLAAIAVGCDSPPVVDDCHDPQCHRDGGLDAGTKRDAGPPPDSVVPDSGPSRSPLCGTVGCIPGNANACGPAPLVEPPVLRARRQVDDASGSTDVITGADGSVDAGIDADDASNSSDASKPADANSECRDGESDGATEDITIDTAEPDATEDTATPPDGAEDAAPPTEDASVDSGGADAAIDMGTTDEPKIVQSCYIKPAAMGVTTECAPTGAGAEGSACNDSHECGAFLACVEIDRKATCQSVLCALPPDCSKGTYYQEAPLRANGTTRTDLNVPVCLHPDNCTLLAPTNPCPSGKVCAVVGSEGETSCSVPGSVKVGEACDDTSRCSEGLLCSKFSNQCVKICHVDAGPIDCPTGTCQGGNRSLPDGFGICVGQTDGG